MFVLQIVLGGFRLVIIVSFLENCSKDFRKLLDDFDVVQSFSGRGCPYDNAVAQSFFKYLKKEEIYIKTYSDFSGLQSSLFEYIDRFYNPKRPHSSNDFLSPDDFESAYFLHLS